MSRTALRALAKSLILYCEKLWHAQKILEMILREERIAWKPRFRSAWKSESLRAAAHAEFRDVYATLEELDKSGSDETELAAELLRRLPVSKYLN